MINPVELVSTTAPRANPAHPLTLSTLVTVPVQHIGHTALSVAESAAKDLLCPLPPTLPTHPSDLLHLVQDKSLEIAYRLAFNISPSDHVQIEPTGHWIKDCIIEPLKARICPAPALWSPNQALLTVLSNEPVKTKTLVWLFATTGMVTAAWAYNAYTQRGPRLLAQAIEVRTSRPAQSLFNVFCGAVKVVTHVAVATCFLVFAVHAPALAEPGVRAKLLEPVVEFASTAAPVVASQLVLYVVMALAGLLPALYRRSVSHLSPLGCQVSEKAGATWSSVKDVAKKTRSDIKAQLTPLPILYQRSVSCVSSLCCMCLHTVIAWMSVVWMCVYDAANKTRSILKALPSFYQRSVSCLSSLVRYVCAQAAGAWTSANDAANKTLSTVKALPCFYRRSVSSLSPHARHVCAQATGASTSVYDAVKQVPMQVVEQLRAAVNCLVACLLLIAAHVVWFMIVLVMNPGSLLISLIEGLEEAYNRAVSALNVLFTWHQRWILWLSITRAKVVEGLSTTRDRLFTTRDKVVGGLSTTRDKVSSGISTTRGKVVCELSTTRGKVNAGIATLLALTGLLLPAYVALGLSLAWIIVTHARFETICSIAERIRSLAKVLPVQASVEDATVASIPIGKVNPVVTEDPAEDPVEDWFAVCTALYEALYENTVKGAKTDWLELYECPREFAIEYDPPCTDTSSTPALRDEEQFELLDATNELWSYRDAQQTFTGALADFGQILKDTKEAYESRGFKRGHHFLVDMHPIRSQYEVYSTARRSAMSMVDQLLSDPRSEDFKAKLLAFQADQDIVRYEHQHSRLLDQCGNLSDDVRGYLKYMIEGHHFIRRRSYKKKIDLDDCWIVPPDELSQRRPYRPCEDELVMAIRSSPMRVMPPMDTRDTSADPSAE